MRGLVEALPSPHPLASYLPAVYLEEDQFTARLTAAIDDSLAPIVSTLDNLAAYFDPRHAPEDFLGWLAGWVALELDETWDVARRRDAIARAVDLLRRRGTAAGLADEIRLVIDGEVEIAENGGSAWSLDAGSAMVGSARPSLAVRLRVRESAKVDLDRINRLIEAAKPAHVPHTVELTGTDRGRTARRATTTRQTAEAPPDEGPADS